MAVVALASLFGVIAGLWFRPPVDIVFLTVVFPCLLTMLWWFGGRSLALVLSCYVYAALLADAWLASWPGDAYFQQDVRVYGCVSNFPRHTDRSTAFLFRVAQTDDVVLSQKLIYLRIYDSEQRIEPASCHEFWVRLKPPHGLTNAGQFDRQIWLMRQRVVASGYVRAIPVNPSRIRVAEPPGFLGVRAAIDQRIRESMAEPSVAALVSALSVGSRADISSEQWNVFRATGTLHLMAISGLHVALVAGGVWSVLLAQGRRCQVHLQPYVMPFACLLSGLVALIYAQLAGWSVPASRAALMFIVFILFFWLRRPVATTEILFFVLWLVVMADPFVVLFGGFWMSFFAVWLLLTLVFPAPLEHADRAGTGTGVVRIKIAVQSLVRAQWRLSTGLITPNVLLFNSVSLLAPVLNLVAIPLFSLFILPLTLLGVFVAMLFPVVATDVLAIPEVVLKLSMKALGHASHWSIADGQWREAVVGADVILVLTGLLFLLPPPLRSLRAWACCVLAVASVEFLRVPDALRIDILDVGQGTAVLIRTSQHAMLLDTGPAWPGGDAGAATVLPFLAAQKLRNPDMIMISHSDGDHSGGLATVRHKFPGTPVMMPRPEAHDPAWRCRHGMRWQWDEVEFRVLHPRTVTGWSDNNASCVLAVRYRGAQALFPGDIESAAEFVMLARNTELQSDLLVVPHHGSGTSSGEQLTARVRPSYAVHTTSYWNRWSFPATEVVERWHAVGSCQLNTARTGALAFSWQARRGLALAEVRSARWIRPWAVRPQSDNYCLEA